MAKRGSIFPPRTRSAGTNQGFKKKSRSAAGQGKTTGFVPGSEKSSKDKMMGRRGNRGR
jgi:hypothetical protein